MNHWKAIWSWNGLHKMIYHETQVIIICSSCKGSIDVLTATRTQLLICQQPYHLPNCWTAPSSGKNQFNMGVIGTTSAATLLPYQAQKLVWGSPCFGLLISKNVNNSAHCSYWESAPKVHFLSLRANLQKTLFLNLTLKQFIKSS